MRSLHRPTCRQADHSVGPARIPDGVFVIIEAASFDRGRRPRDLEKLLNALIGARASRARRGPTYQDLEVALCLVGLHQDYDPSGETAQRLNRLREKWLDEMAHDPWPARSALAAIPVDLLMDTPTAVRTRLQVDPSLVS